MTARRIRADELLDLAALLAGSGAGRGRPRAVRLRRAVSSAYYAVFHEVEEHVVSHFYGAGAPSEAQRNAVGRWITHSDVRVLASAVTTSGTRPVVAMAFLPASDDLRRIADGIVELQEARLLADHDHAYDIDKRQALTHVATARDVLERSRTALQGHDQSYLVFLSLLMGAVQSAKKR